MPNKIPFRSSIRKMPSDLKAELERKIIEEDYQGFEELCEWTKTKGFPISKSSLHRHKQRLVDQDTETERTATKPKEPGKMSRAELERENGYLSAHLVQLSARQAAVQRELIRHMGGISSPTPAPSRPATTHCPIVTKAKQLDAVKAALLAREPVNPVEANRQGWGLRLGALIHRLRGQGWPVHAERDHGNGMARYRLPDGWEPPKPARDRANPPADSGQNLRGNEAAG